MSGEKRVFRDEKRARKNEEITTENERWAFICELRTITPSLRDPTPTDSHSPPATQPQLPIEPSQTTPAPKSRGTLWFLSSTL